MSSLPEVIVDIAISCAGENQPCRESGMDAIETRNVGVFGGSGGGGGKTSVGF